MRIEKKDGFTIPELIEALLKCRQTGDDGKPVIIQLINDSGYCSVVQVLQQLDDGTVEVDVF